MTLRLRIVLLVATALAPMAICAVVAALLLLDQERSVMERGATGRARSAMSAVDAHLRGTILGLETLAASKNLESGDIAAFHAESQRVLRGQPAWVNIGLASAAKREQLFNAVYALGRPEPFGLDDDSFDAVLKGAKVAFGNVLSGTAVRNPTARVRIGVSYGNELRYVLSAPLNMKQLADVLQAQKLPDGWMIALIDRNQHVIAAQPPVPTGTPALDELRKAIERSPEGWMRIDGAEGPAMYSAHVTSDLSGWVLAIGVPPAYVEAGARRSLTILAAGVLSALLLGILLAWVVARSTSDARA